MRLRQQRKTRAISAIIYIYIYIYILQLICIIMQYLYYLKYSGTGKLY